VASSKKNCWEFMKCGREPGGINAEELGICPAPIETRADGINGGKNAGRVCWVVAGTFCEGEVQGTSAKKLQTCLECKFYKMMWKEDKNHILAESEKLRSLRFRPPSKKI